MERLQPSVTKSENMKNRWEQKRVSCINISGDIDNKRSRASTRKMRKTWRKTVKPSGLIILKIQKKLEMQVKKLKKSERSKENTKQAIFSKNGRNSDCSKKFNLKKRI
jgi:hypothetical protein